MPLRSRIFELNGLKFGDFPEKKQKELLEGLLQESESFWGHERNVVPHKLPVLLAGTTGGKAKMQADPPIQAPSR